MNGITYHVPVLLNEVIEHLQVKKGGRYIDCTLGGGGHTKAILEHGGEVLAIDQDPEALRSAEENFKFEILNLKLILKHNNFSNLKQVANGVGWTKVDGILMDLGVSTHQLETDYRGFSFNKAGNLDMRMDQGGQAVTALDLIKAGSEKELEKIFREFGEENFAGPIARAIKKSKVQTTDDLAKVILRVRSKGRGERAHPATRVFQALRIAVNDELNNLKEGLPQAVELLTVGSRLLVISFHSLEDRIVKEFFKNKQKPITPSEEEIKANPRARSGKLRVYEKIAE
jgi:16S rRNA (cytosine1402-N4)-methyltransferase